MPRHALVIAVDGLRASALGAYGNAWHPTPALDALASQSTVFDWAFGSGPLLEDFYQAAWGTPADSLMGRFKAIGGSSKLLTDDREVAQFAERLSFDEIEQVALGGESRAASVAETHLGEFFAAALEECEAWPAQLNDHPRLLWLHLRGLRGPWDAPLELREQLLEEDDPPAPRFVPPPDAVSTTDHDELLLYRAAYAGQIIALDECLGVLLDALRESPMARDLAIVLVGARGYALGEHGRVGSEVHDLYGELLHIPLLMHLPGDETPPPRSVQLSQPQDLRLTLLEWLGVSSSAATIDRERQFITACNRSGERIVRTPAWMLRQVVEIENGSDASAMPSVELFAKPDDRWEANEIADRCPEVAERLLAILERAAADPAKQADFPQLDGDLLRPWR
jgi:hypothetical protein